MGVPAITAIDALIDRASLRARFLEIELGVPHLCRDLGPFAFDLSRREPSVRRQRFLPAPEPS